MLYRVKAVCVFLYWCKVYLGLTWLTGILRRAAMSSTVSLPSEMIPTPLAMALAVMGWSPVTMMTLIPAERHLPTASGTAARGGSIMDIRPTKHRLSVWKLTSSVSKANPLGYLSSGMNKWQKPGWKEEKRLSDWIYCTVLRIQCFGFSCALDLYSCLCF